ncbi:hypothetical protein G7Y89_g10819 [Cudoniella acicularis]|uniref:lytic cellulose monooxygenase (C4-dehydrogenating) n=1 Tax=Cudoniella acicularis TaxID=354080 RepID=A0A8H4RFN4_9HELO|nr:hypothetical protein G7Y89_g10819 [Cudoniella acicularis]
MRFFTGFLLAIACTAVHGHYTFPRLVVNGKPEAKDWSVTRMTKNVNSKSGVESVASGDIRCYQSKNADNITTIPAGATVHFISTQQVNHPGPFQFYLAKVPAGMSAQTWDGSGEVWFKFHTEMPAMTKDKQLTWPGQNEYKTTNATIPKSVPSGEYLLRVEHIALHLASAPNKAQFYLSCAQVKITGDGNGNPGPLVAFPGAYKTSDPGILINLGALATPDSYVPPGPAVWSG